MKNAFLIIAIIFLAPPFVNILAQNEEGKEDKKLVVGSQLNRILDSRGLELENLKISDIREILKGEKENLIGGTSDLAKFYTLSSLSTIIKKHPNREDLQSDLFSLFRSLKVSKDKPKNWGEYLVDGAGGSLGLITECLLASSGKEMQSKIVDYLLEEDQPDKAKLVLEKAKITGKKAELANLLRQNIEVAKSEEMKNLFRNFIEETPSK